MFECDATTREVVRLLTASTAEAEERGLALFDRSVERAGRTLWHAMLQHSTLSSDALELVHRMQAQGLSADGTTTAILGTKVLVEGRESATAAAAARSLGLSARELQSRREAVLGALFARPWPRGRREAWRLFEQMKENGAVDMGTALVMSSHAWRSEELQAIIRYLDEVGQMQPSSPNDGQPIPTMTDPQRLYHRLTKLLLVEGKYAAAKKIPKRMSDSGLELHTVNRKLLVKGRSTTAKREKHLSILRTQALTELLDAHPTAYEEAVRMHARMVKSGYVDDHQKRLIDKAQVRRLISTARCEIQAMACGEGKHITLEGLTRKLLQPQALTCEPTWQQEVVHQFGAADERYFGKTKYKRMIQIRKGSNSGPSNRAVLRFLTIYKQHFNVTSNGHGDYYVSVVGKE